MQKFLEEMGYIMNVISDVVWQFRNGNGLNHCFVIILFELSLIVVVQCIGGVEISRNSE